MSNAKEILERISTMLFSKEESTEEKVELAQVKTADGAAIFDAEAFEIGQAVFIVTEEGNIPVPTGEYMLEEGLKIKVDEQGVIVEVETEGAEEVAEEVEAKDEPMKEETGMMESAPKKVVKSKTEMEESYFSKIETRLSAIEKSNEDLKAVNVQLSAENEELKKQLAETPAPHTKFNPDAEAQRDVKFKIGARREETIQDRVFNQLF
jgi:fructose-specific phosphotransferase system component IIB